VSLEHLQTLSHTNIPKSAGAVNGSSRAVLSGEFELGAGDFLFMADQLMDWITNACVPDDGCFIE
jgi:hypothetical protein